MVKKNALKCLTVIFRDLLNYSRQSINMILKPAWKHLNQTLPIYTEFIGYGNNLEQSDDDNDDDDGGSDQGRSEDSWEAEDVDPGEMNGVEGMVY